MSEDILGSIIFPPCSTYVEIDRTPSAGEKGIFIPHELADQITDMAMFCYNEGQGFLSDEYLTWIGDKYPDLKSTCDFLIKET